MKRMCAVVTVVLAFLLSAAVFAGETRTISYDIDLGQFLPQGGETDEELQQLAIQYKLNFNLMKEINDPVWSPDGSTIAVIDNTARAICTVSVESGETILVTPELMESFTYDWVPMGDSTQPMQRSEDPGDYRLHLTYGPVFTPDNKEITYTAVYFDKSRGSIFTQTSAYYEIKNCIPSIESVDLATGEKHCLVKEGKCPAWSPDGRYLTYINFDSRIFTNPDETEHHGALALLDTATGETTYFTDFNTSEVYDGEGFLQPSFSPDGSQIVFIYEQTLCTIPVTGGEITRLTDSIDNGHGLFYPSFSPDGRWILFSYGWYNNEWMMVYDTESEKTFKVSDGTIITDIASLSGKGEPFSGKWSPDGSKICAIAVNSKTISHPYGYDETVEARELCIIDFAPGTFDTSIPTAVEADTPVDFAIRGNYPNPFNPTTTIEFTIPEQGMATLAIYNMAGQAVRELLAGELSRGNHTTVWDGRDASGNMVSSGIYFARLKAGNFAATRQMMLMK